MIIKQHISIFLFFFLSCLYLIGGQHHELLPYNPVANSDAVVVSGNARFTVLTSQLIRMEYSSSGSFEDRATLAFLNRALPVPKFTHSVTSGTLNIETDHLKLSFTVGQTFSSSSLSVVSLDPTTKFAWHYGIEDTGNLLGTIKSLDQLGVISLNCTENKGHRVHDEDLHCEWGLISRNGWAVVDDSKNQALDKNDWWGQENADDIDLYFFGHGLNYKQALNDYVLVGGRTAMVPRYASGIWWSVWYNLNNDDVRDVVRKYEEYAIPLDTYILDMDWHTKDGWGGYTFDDRLFPFPQNTLGWLHQKGLHSGANVHDADGVRPSESQFKELAKYMGLDPNSKSTIPFEVCVNSTYAYGLEDVVLGYDEKLGMDFWWIDWQQGGTKGGCKGLKQNPTIWLNKLRCTDHIRRGDDQRAMVLARWGGLGNHRYQVGFSGDVAGVVWKNLAFQPYFSLTATNVGYGFWSHDIVGPANDHELHTRWVQWGAFSGIFRTHDRGMSGGGCANNNPPSCGIVKIWDIPTKYFQAARKALVAREQLIPYIYNASRTAFDTGLSIIRPMYYDWPGQENAYKADQDGNFAQYLFGEDILVSPVVFPANSTTSMTTTSIWIPPGKWYEEETGVLITGPTILKKAWDLSEVPRFVRAGAIIPQIKIRPGHTIAQAQLQYDNLVFVVYPGATSFSTSVYEDDGMTTSYLNNEYTWIKADYTRSDTVLKFQISSEGSFEEMPKSRSYELHVVSALPPTSAMVNGQKVDYSASGGANTWRYDGDRLTVIIQTGSISSTQDVSIVVNTDPIDDTLMSGVRGGIAHSILSKRNLDASRVTPGAHSVSGGTISRAASAGIELQFLAGTDLVSFTNILKGYKATFAAAVKEIEALKPGAGLRAGVDAVNYDRWAYSMELLNNAMN